MGLRLLKGTNTVRSAKHKLKALLHSLQDSSLLLKDDTEDPVYVHIHDVVREVAIRIASKDQCSLLITDEFELKEISWKKLKNSKSISILHSHVNFRRLPEGWVCPELRMFLLYRSVDNPLIGISDSFFEGMKELSVLDITGRRCDSLPSSIQFLLNLNTLCLDRCSIEDLTIIGKLKQLQILTFRGSEIARLPKEIGELSELKVLNLENSKLEIIEPQVLGNLTSLEELSMKGSTFTGWEDEGEMQPSNAKVSELNNMSNLSIVNIHIHNPSTIPKHLGFGNVAEYMIQIGDVWDWTGNYKESRMLKIKLELCRKSFLHEKWVQDLLKRTQNLHLDGTKGWQRSIHELCLDGFPELKHLHIQNNSLVQCVARSTSKWSPICTAFTVLESLYLEKLTGLETISRGPVASDSFSKLKVIKVIGCGKLKSLFSYSMLICISQLEEIEVRDCEAIEVIVTVDSVATNTEAVKLEALHQIELHNLPNLMTFCSSQKVEADQTEIKPSSSEIVQEDPCIHTNTMFPNDQLVSFPLLKLLILTSLPKLKYIWQNHSSVEVAKLEKLKVSSCDDLLIVIPSSLVKEVKNLEALMVRDCGSVQEVFETGDDDVALNLTSNDVEILSRLNKLKLSNLPFLKHILGNNHQLEKVSVFQNLNLLVVMNCSSLMNLLPAASLKSINKMKAAVPPENDGIRSGETKNIVLQSLADVWLEDLPNMVTFVWTKRGESIKFPSMKRLYVKECPKMTSFSLVKEDESAPAELCFFDDKVLLPKLARLYLISVRIIQKIWHEEIPEQSFGQLEKLVVKDCQALVDVIPSINLRAQFDNLKDIMIRGCNSLEGPVFKFSVEETAGKEYNKGHYLLPQLENLWLSDLPKLKHVVQPDSHVTVGFPSLVKISFVFCECAIYVFPIATAATLSKLKDLKVLRCSSMRQIFGKDEAGADEEEEDEMIGFPSLEALEIGCCSKLKTFVQSDHTSEQTLERSSSPFTKESVHYLFDDKVEFPNLQKMTVSECKDLQHIFTASFASNLAQLEELCIRSCGELEEIVMHGDIDYGSIEELEGINSSEQFFFPQLTSLELSDLPNLRSFFRGSNASTWSALKKLWMWHCDKVQLFTTKFSSSNSENSSTRQSLFSAQQVIPKLEILRLVEEDVIMIQDGEFKEDMFTELKCFSLACFHNAGAAAFPSRFLLEDKFQKIERLNVYCSSFEEIFADESLSPQEILSYKERLTFAGEGNEKPLARLREVRLSKLHNLKHVWKADMTVFDEILKSIQLLELWDCPKLKNLFPTASCCFGNITTIKVEKCNGMQELVTTSAATSLVKLTKLDIYDCGMIETIVSANGSKTAEDDGELVITFRELKHIGLHRLPSLTSFSSANCKFELPSLEEVIVTECKNLMVFSSNSVVAPKLSKVLLTEKEQTGKVRWDGDLNTTIQNLPK